MTRLRAPAAFGFPPELNLYAFQRQATEQAARSCDAAVRLRLPATVGRELHRCVALAPARRSARARVQRLRGLGGAELGPAALRTSDSRIARRTSSPPPRPPRRYRLAGARGRAGRARRRAGADRLAIRTASMPTRFDPARFTDAERRALRAAPRHPARRRRRDVRRHVRPLARRRRARAGDRAAGRGTTSPGSAARACASCSSATGCKMADVRAAVDNPACRPYVTLTGLVPQDETPRHPRRLRHPALAARPQSRRHARSSARRRSCSSTWRSARGSSPPISIRSATCSSRQRVPKEPSTRGPSPCSSNRATWTRSWRGSDASSRIAASPTTRRERAREGARPPHVAAPRAGDHRPGSSSPRSRGASDRRRRRGGPARAAPPGRSAAARGELATALPIASASVGCAASQRTASASASGSSGATTMPAAGPLEQPRRLARRREDDRAPDRHEVDQLRRARTARTSDAPRAGTSSASLAARIAGDLARSAPAAWKCDVRRGRARATASTSAVLHRPVADERELDARRSDARQRRARDGSACAIPCVPANVTRNSSPVDAELAAQRRSGVDVEEELERPVRDAGRSSAACRRIASMCSQNGRVTATTRSPGGRASARGDRAARASSPRDLLEASRGRRPEVAHVEHERRAVHPRERTRRRGR